MIRYFIGATTTECTILEGTSTPKLLLCVYDILIRFLGQLKSGRRPNLPRSQARTNVSLIQTGVGDVVPGNDLVTHKDIECYNCRKKGHYSGNCNVPDRRGITGNQNLQGSHMFHAEASLGRRYY